MKRVKKDVINGWLIIDKEVGVGSTQVVNQTRYLLNAQKNGHTGTLDPFATGVLPIAFGEATKLVPYIMDGKKEYEFVVRFGATTDTLDCTGNIIEQDLGVPTEEEIKKCLGYFIGKIEQVPPAYSAIKVNGKRAYDLVRKGEKVDIPVREVEIYRLEMIEFLPPESARFVVECSKGTYVRTLGADLAKKLGTLGYLTELRRTKCGNFRIDDTILLESLKNIEYIAERQKKLLPLLTSLCDITVIAVREDDAIKLRKGQAVSPRNYKVDELVGREVAAVCSDRLVAMVRIDERRISPVRVFNL
ncbi:MAG: tRNA pseudouridine(55) synthase TruB [Alphaproteobacteria bacterium]|nr:tRNA pseudouridine(55) synthase TruB [Alphaproteobacteria bacterium]